MRHDPGAGLRQAIVDALVQDAPMWENEAPRIAADVSERYFSCVNVGDRHFTLLNVTLRWQALCGGVVEGTVRLSGGLFAGRLLIGALRWFDGMRYYHQFGATHAPDREDVAVDHVEAALCMALWKREGGGTPYWPEDPLVVLLDPVNEILREAAYAPIDREQLREAVDRLKTLQCLTPRAGWFGLREEMRYQVPEE